MSGRDEAVQRCQDCGGVGPGLSVDGFCLICEEVRVRVDAGLGAAMAEFTDHVVSIAIDYLHPDDVRKIVKEQIAWRADMARADCGDYDGPRSNEERFQLGRGLEALRVDACGGAALPPPKGVGDL